MDIIALTVCDGLSRKERMDMAHDEIKTLYDTQKNNSIGNITKLSGLSIHLVQKVVKDYKQKKDAYSID